MECLSVDQKRRRRIHALRPTTINAEVRPRRESLRRQLLSQLFFKRMAQLFKKKRQKKPSTVWYDKVAFPPSAWQGPARVSPYGYESDSENEEYTCISSASLNNVLTESLTPTQNATANNCSNTYSESPAVLHLERIPRDLRETDALDSEEVYLDGFVTTRSRSNSFENMGPVKRRLYSKKFCRQFAAINIILLMLNILVLTGIVYRGFGKGCL
ncbi:membrane protein V1 [Equid alphaherpesvirus 4]|nr:membrane protein V1 [Equid alphaherpesvirus 4]QYL35272.1 membrane protein V1 [Equid alphaherpesvirus 4]QYL35349.1 membrane protein V1 [Equid alphaherpesvirus 4]QYL35427.1 membrane protein V1 [Equid alphaherpesvirus 4]